MVLFTVATLIVVNEENKYLVEEHNSFECAPCNQDIEFVQEAFELMNYFCYDELAECKEQNRMCVEGESSPMVTRE